MVARGGDRTDPKTTDFTEFLAIDRTRPIAAGDGVRGEPEEALGMVLRSSDLSQPRQTD